MHWNSHILDKLWITGQIKVSDIFDFIFFAVWVAEIELELKQTLKFKIHTRVNIGIWVSSCKHQTNWIIHIQNRLSNLEIKEKGWELIKHLLVVFEHVAGSTNWDLLRDNIVNLGFVFLAIGFWKFLSFGRFSEVDELDFLFDISSSVLFSNWPIAMRIV